MGAFNSRPDSLTRALRGLAAVAFLILIAFLVIDPNGNGHDNGLIALLIGGLALWLGYEGIVLPFMRRGK
jgi:Zn-dependent protease with chaperone function